MPCKVTFNFVAQSSKLGGWQMNFWNSASTPALAAPRAAGLAPFLRSVVGAQAYIQTYRISDVSNFRNVQNFYTNQAPTPPSTSTDGDYPAVALQMKLSTDPSSNPVYKTLQWIRGIPDICIANGGKYQPTVFFNIQLNTMFSVLRDPSQGWSIYCLNKATPHFPVTGWNNATGVVTVPGHNYGPLGTIVTVRIKGCGLRNKLDAIWTVTVQDANTVSINNYTPFSPVVVITGKKPTCTAQVYQAFQIANTGPGIISTHKTGRPTNQLGGRRKARVA